MTVHLEGPDELMPVRHPRIPEENWPERIASPWEKALADVRRDELGTCPHGHKSTWRCGACEDSARQLIHFWNMEKLLEQQNELLRNLLGLAEVDGLG